jgi:hypothetical protein
MQRCLLNYSTSDVLPCAHALSFPDRAWGWTSLAYCCMKGAMRMSCMQRVSSCRDHRDANGEHGLRELHARLLYLTPPFASRQKQSKTSSYTASYRAIPFKRHIQIGCHLPLRTQKPKQCSCLITAPLFTNYSTASSLLLIMPLPSGGERQRTWKNQFQARGLMGSPTVPSTAREERSLPSTNLSSCASSARISVGAV